jgi:hypothetical protein
LDWNPAFYGIYDDDFPKRVARRRWRKA